MPKMSEGRRAQIVLLDGQRLDILVQPRLFVSELLSMVASHCELRDPDRHYFGIAFVDEQNHYHWLPRDRRVLEFEFPRHASSSNALLILQHNVKFFVDSIACLNHPSTVELYFLEAKLQLSKGHLILSDVDFYRTGAALLQVWAGDYKDDESALAVLRTIVSIPQRFLRNYGVTLADCESNIVDAYRDLTGTPRGCAILSFMQIAERSPTYGSHFYAVCDKAGASWLLGINSRGICQYSVDDITVAKKVFHWRFLENLYYRDRKFSIEVHDKRRIVHSLSSSNLESLLGANGVDDGDDDLLDAVNHPTTQVSLSRRAFAPSSVFIHAFFCASPFLCKTLWSAAIAQHQFYLDQRASHNSKSRLNGGSHSRQSGVNLNELTAKLNRLVSDSSLGSSLPSLSSLNSCASTHSTMPSARVADGGSSAGSLPSLQSAYSHRSDEERLRDVERYKELKTKKNELTEKLTALLQELRVSCVQEGEITGEMPKEINRCLMPGEPEPKIKRRVGTSFSIPQDLLEKQLSKEDRVGRLEADIEMQRQIVLAARRLATDKSTNKSVRKKRQKDYQHLNSRLKQLEMNLKMMRMSASKPDVSACNDRGRANSAAANREFCPRANKKGPPFPSARGETVAAGELARSSFGAWPNFSGDPGSFTPQLNRLVARSCPATPRGSVPDLCPGTGTNTDYEHTDIDEDEFSRPPSAASSLRVRGGSNGLPPAPSRRPTMPSLSVSQRLHSDRRNTDYSVPIAPPSSSHNTPFGSSPNLPIYENVGYKTSVPYKSSYRQTHFPTLHDQQEWRVQRAHSEHSLPSDSSGIASSGTPDPPASDYRTVGNDVIGHNGLNKAMFVNDDDADDGIGAELRSEEDCTLESTGITPSIEDNRYSRVAPQIRGGTPSSQSSLSAFIFGKKPTQAGGAVSPLRHAIPPMSGAGNDGFGTASLDRRAIKNRQNSAGLVTTCSPIANGDMVGANSSPDRASPLGLRRDSMPTSPPYREEQLIGRQSAAGVSPTVTVSPVQAGIQRFTTTTTFPVNQPGASSRESSKPFESSDVHRYQQQLRPRSPLVANGCSSSTSSTSSLTSSSPRHTNHPRPPPPAYAAVLVQRNSSGRLQMPGGVGSSSTIATKSPGFPRTDPKMEALLDYCKTSSGVAGNAKPKTATIV